MTKIEAIDKIYNSVRNLPTEWSPNSVEFSNVKIFIGECLQEAYQQGKNHGMIDGTKFPWTS